MALEVDGGRTGPLARIDVTPMADVIIVLLIIFMVTVPLLQQDVDLPDAAHAARSSPEGQLVVTIEGDGTLRVGPHRLAGDAVLVDVLRDALRGRADGTVHLRADEALDYARVEAVLDACRVAGATRVAVAAERGIGG